MLKLVKFLKPFTLLVILNIVLLYAQASADLALPDYMSNIVNTGIQQSGFEKAVLEVIKEDDFNQISRVTLDESEQHFFVSSYDLIDYESHQFLYIELENSYTQLNRLPVYRLKKLDATEEQTLTEITTKMLIKAAALQGAPIEYDALSGKMLEAAGITAVKNYTQSLGYDVESLQNNYIIKSGVQMLLIALIGAAASIGVGLIASRVAAGLSRNLRKSIFDKVLSFSSTEMDSFTTASLITRSTNDVNQIQNVLVMMLRMLFYAPLMGIGGVIRALDKSVSMSWIIAVAVLILLGIIMVVFTIAIPKFKMIQKLIDRLNLVVRENLMGMMVIRSFNTQHFEEDRFDKANLDLTRTNLFVNRLMTFLMPVMMLIMNGVSLMIIWTGAHQIEASQMQVGDMMAFMQYALQIIFSFLMLSMMFIMVPRATVSAGRIAEILETEPMIKDYHHEPVNTDAVSGSIRFESVSFKYPGAEENVLKNITFTVPTGKVTAIIGATGSGKSTLVNLIPRFYEATEGEIFFDTMRIKDISQFDLRKMIGYVPQKSILFSGTIESNLKFGDAFADDFKLNRAIEIAQAKNIIEEKPEGILAPISQSGANVSGGQKQRLSIARAIVKNPKLYIFDDSFSALDFKTDVTLRKALKEEIKEATVIIVAQRISTILSADQIIVLDEGKIVGSGTHKELLSSCETYKEIAMSQLSAEELQ